MNQETWGRIISLTGDARMAALYVMAANAALVPAVKRLLGMDIEVRESVVLPGGTRTIRTDGPETDELHMLMDAFTLGFKAAADVFGQFGDATNANAAKLQREPGTSRAEAMSAFSAMEWRQDAIDLREALADLLYVEDGSRDAAYYSGRTAAWQTARTLLEQLERRDERRRAAKVNYEDPLVKDGGEEG